MFITSRNFVTKELYPSNESCPERHDLTLFPTVNDLKNRIHQAFKDLESGKLARVFPSVSTISELSLILKIYNHITL